MPRKPNENYHEYRDRIIDPISPSFCAAKWYNSTIWLGQGNTTSCHHPHPHKIDLNEIKDNPSAIHNTTYKKSLRKMMLEGTRPPECGYCWRVEDMGKDHISDRVFKTVIYDDKDIETISKQDWNTDVNLKTLEIAFDRTCNFSCSYCNASYSTAWSKDIKNNGNYENLVSKDHSAFTHDGSWADPFKDKDENPYINAFWEWWPELSTSLQELRITGGEPLMSVDVWRLLDMFKVLDIDHIRLAINTNLGAKESLISKLIEASHHIKQLDIYTSCESVGAQAEYIRDGMIYDTWKANVERLLTEGNVQRLHFMMTINALCIFSITELMDQIIKWKYQFNRENGKIGMSFNMLSYPSFQAPHVLPYDLRMSAVNKMIAWKDSHRDEPAFEMHERESFQRMIDFLSTPNKDDTNSKMDVQDFKNFYAQYDVRRSKSFSVFPTELTNWFNSIKVNRTFMMQSI